MCRVLDNLGLRWREEMEAKIVVVMMREEYTNMKKQEFV